MGAVRAMDGAMSTLASPARESSTKPAESILAMASSMSADAAKAYTPVRAPATGTYNLSAGLLSANPMGEYVGDTGSGLINQTGGTNSTYTVTLGGGVSGAYSLNGGLLQTNAINDAGGAVFTFTAGTLQAGTGWYPTVSWALPINVTGTSPARIDMNGMQVSITSLVINSSLADLNFQTPGVDLLTVGGLTINDPVALSFGTSPTVAGYYPLIGGNLGAIASDSPGTGSAVHPSRGPGRRELRVGRGVGKHRSTRNRARTGDVGPLGRGTGKSVGDCLATAEGRLI